MSIKEILYNWGTLNIDIFYFFNNLFIDNTIYSTIMLLISLFFNFFVLMTLLLSSLIIYSFHNRSIFCSNKPYIMFNPPLYALLLAIFTSFFAAVIGYSIKYLYALEYPRPLCILSDVGIVPYFGQTITEVIEKRCNNLDGSFPSMHSTFAMIVAMSAWPLLKNYYIKLLVIALLIAVGISRISLGVHFPSDIMGGFIFGYVLTNICLLILSNFIKYINNKSLKY